MQTLLKLLTLTTIAACAVDDTIEDGDDMLGETEQSLDSYGLAFDYKAGFGVLNPQPAATPLVEAGVLGWAGEWHDVLFIGAVQDNVTRTTTANGTKTGTLELAWKPFYLPADGTYVVRAPLLTVRGNTKVSGRGYAWSPTDAKASATMSVDLSVGSRSIVAKDYTLMTDATSSETRTKSFDKTYDPLNGITFQGFAGEPVQLRANFFAHTWAAYSEGSAEVAVKQFGFFSNTANATVAIEQ